MPPILVSIHLQDCVETKIHLAARSFAAECDKLIPGFNSEPIKSFTKRSCLQVALFREPIWKRRSSCFGIGQFWADNHLDARDPALFAVFLTNAPHDQSPSPARRWAKFSVSSRAVNSP